MPSVKNRRSPWLILAVVLLTSVAASLNQFKVPPILPLLMDFFHLPAGRAGLLMSVFAITGLLLALPAGFFFQKLGYRMMGLMAVGFLAVGAATGALSRGEGMMLSGRLLEGAGMSLIAVVCPAIVAIWFSPDQRGKAMGIFATWVPLGSTVVFLLAPSLAHRWRWEGVWWFGFLYTFFVGILFYQFVKTANQPSANTNFTGFQQAITIADVKKVFQIKDLWLISFLFACFNYAFVSFVTWVPAFLHGVRGRSLEHASFAVSTVSMLAILSCPLAGLISDRLGSRKMIFTLPMILMGILIPFTCALPMEFFLPFLIIFGFITGFAPTGVFSAAAEVVGDERLTGMAMAIVQIGQNFGMLAGPFIFGTLVESSGGWELAFWTLAPICGAGAVAGALSRVR